MDARNELRPEDMAEAQAPVRDGSIQVDEDMRWQRRTWVIQRIGWVAMGLFLLIALTGVLASGPLSWAKARDQSGLVRIEYERFHRRLAPFTLRVDLGPQSAIDGAVSLRLSGGIVHAAEVERVVPEPQDTKATEHGIEYTFQVADPGKPTTIRFFLKFHESGSASSEIGLSGREPIRLTQFVYP